MVHVPSGDREKGKEEKRPRSQNEAPHLDIAAGSPCIGIGMRCGILQLGRSRAVVPSWNFRRPDLVVLGGGGGSRDGRGEKVDSVRVWG